MFTNRTTSRIFSVLFNILLVLTLLIGVAAFPNSASAASTITVTTSADNTTFDGQCSLREAIINANADNQSGSMDCTGGSGTDTITFDADYTVTLVGSQLPEVTSTIVINGNGVANTIIQANASPNIATYRVFEVSNTGDLSLNSLTIKNGRCDGNGGCTININYGGGILNAGTLTITNSRFSGNLAVSGGVVYNSGTLTITNSTFSDNTAFGSGGVVTNLGTLTITNSTFSGNTASSGGGIYNYISGTLILNNSIIANSTSGGDCFNFFGTVSGSHNLIEVDGNPSFPCGTTDLISSDPGLAALADNGGPTQTFALTASSPVIDAGDNTICDDNPGPNNLDQRGVTRPQGMHCDIGSFESFPFDTTAPAVSSSVRTNTNPTSGTSVDFTVTFSESVNGVDISDFALTTTGVSGAFIMDASGSDATYTVSVDTGSGDGTIRLDVLDDDSILDAASNPLNGGFTGGETYNVDKNDAPTSISLDNSNVAGNLPVGTLVGAFSSTDADSGDTFTYSLVSGTSSADNASFNIVGDQLQTAAVFDSTVRNSYAIRVRTTDSGDGNLFFEQAFTITITANNVTPSLLSPADQELSIEIRPVFDWTDVLGSIDYRIQINETPAFARSGRVVDTTIAASTFTPAADLPAGIVLYWRVSRNTAAGAGPWSEIHSFTIAAPPSVPSLVSPRGNAKNVSLTPLFDWTDSTPSVGTTLLRYELQLSTDSAFTSPMGFEVVNSNYLISTNLNPNTKYFWRVRACNTLGQCSAWSNVRNFTTL